MRIKSALENIDPSLDSVIVLKKENIYYLTGYFPTTFSVLVLGDEPYLVVSQMDASLVEGVDMEVRIVKSFKKELVFKGRVGVEKGHTNLGFVDEYLKNCELVDIRFVDKMREVKDSEELRRIRKAVKITEEVLLDIKIEGPSEREVAALIAFEISKRCKIAFDPIVSSGKNSAVPHHTPGDRKIKKSDQVIVDLGARYEHYSSDISRTFSYRQSSKFKDVYQAVVEAQKKGIRSIRPGAEVRACEEAIRDVLSEYSFEEYFIHSSGHGVGLEVHEQPKISKESEEIFKKGMVLTVEPGVYIPGWGGIRIEDVIWVGNRPKVLSSYPKLDS
jgi:Xaa-Pro dipeptidase